MTQKLFCVSIALFAALALANVSFAEDAKTVVAAPAATVVTAAPGCPCHHCQTVCDPCCPPVVYRVGPFGVVRPVVYAPVIRPVYCPPRYHYYRPYCAPVYPCGYPCYTW